MSFLDFLLPFLVVLGVLIFVHELGHFIAAKILGVKVESFSIGFGRAVVKRKVGETEYRIAWIPLGGYVRMLGEIPGESLEPGDEGRTFNSRPIWQRIAISAAGPAMNFLLPILLLAGAYVAGVPNATSRIGSVTPDSPAARAGLLPGDRVLSVEGERTEWWAEVSDALADAGPGPVGLEVLRRDEPLEVSLDLTAESDEAGYGLSAAAPAAIVAVRGSESPAAQAGLRTGDRITRVGEREILDWPDLVEALQAVRGLLELEAVRALEDGSVETVRVTVRAAGDHDVLEELGLLSGDLWVQDVESGTPADRAGLRAGDLLLTIDGRAVGSFRELARRVRESGGRPLRIEALREDETLALEVVPEERTVAQAGIREHVYAIGVRGGAPGGAELRPRRVRNPIRALGLGLTWSGEITVRIFEGIGMLVSGQVGREGLAGPIGIGMIAAQSFQAGWVQGILMMAVISINLAILNLLPIPVLDGGHILFALLEGAKGSAVSFRTREIAQQIGITLLLLVMVFAFWNDIARHWADIVGFFQGRF